MNERLTALYVAILENEVVCFDTNLKLFVVKVNKLESKSRNYDWFYRSFKANVKFSQTINDKEYFFQRVI